MAVGTPEVPGEVGIVTEVTAPETPESPGETPGSERYSAGTGPCGDIPALAPGPSSDADTGAVIRLVAGMIGHRGTAIAGLLDEFEEKAGCMHREQSRRRLLALSRELIAIADRIDGLAQDNAYDTRRLMAWLERRQAAGEAGADTVHRGHVCYIQ